MPQTLDPASFKRLCLARDRLREAAEPAPSVTAVAKEAAMSPYHFIRVFTALFGETPHQLRTRARLERAKTLLALGNDEVTDICLDVGFTSLGSFSDLFARRVGAPPSAFRRKMRLTMPSMSELPPEMIPGCLTLMGGRSESSQFPRSALPARPVKLQPRDQKVQTKRGKS